MVKFIVGALFFSGIGLFMSIWGFRGYGTARRGLAAARTWPEATAVVDSTGIHTVERRALGFLFLLTRGRDLILMLLRLVDRQSMSVSGANSYTPQVNYRFQVGGQTITATGSRSGI